MNKAPYEAVFFDLGDTLVVSQNGWVPGAQEVLQRLRSSGLRLGLISNTGTWTRDELRALLPADFDFAFFEPDLVLLSSEVGRAKPDPEIFREAIQRSGVPPARCLFLTETLLDTLSAQGTGMRTVRLSEPPGADFGDLVEKLEELAGLFPERPVEA